MKRTNKPLKPVTVLRWNGEEFRFNEGDREFIQTLLAERLGYRSANVIEIQQTHSSKSHQCVIAELDPTVDYDSNAGALALEEAVMNAGFEQRAFLIQYTGEEYHAIMERRKKSLGTNVYDLFMGYTKDPSPLEPEPTLA